MSVLSSTAADDNASSFNLMLSLPSWSLEIVTYRVHLAGKLKENQQGQGNFYAERSEKKRFCITLYTSAFTKHSAWVISSVCK